MRVRLDKDEADLMRQLIGEMRDVIRADDPHDAVRGRLFPPAYEAGDDEKAFRDLVGDELFSAKLNALDAMEKAIGTTEVVDASLSRDQAEAWLTVLTDMRLAIGTRLDVTEDKMEQEIDADDPDAAAMTVLHWLGWIQESMLEVVSDRHFR